MAKGKRPDYNLHARITTADGTEIKGQIGVAWLKEGPYGEYLSIKLNPCTVIDTNQTNVLLTLFKPGVYPVEGGTDTKDNDGKKEKPAF